MSDEQLRALARAASDDPEAADAMQRASVRAGGQANWQDMDARGLLDSRVEAVKQAHPRRRLLAGDDPFRFILASGLMSGYDTGRPGERLCDMGWEGPGLVTDHLLACTVNKPAEAYTLGLSVLRRFAKPDEPESA